MHPFLSRSERGPWHTASPSVGARSAQRSTEQFWLQPAACRPLARHLLAIPEPLARFLGWFAYFFGGFAPLKVQAHWAQLDDHKDERISKGM